MANLALKYEVIYWLVTGATAFFSFSLLGLLLASIGNIYVRDGLSLVRGLVVLWFIASAAPLFEEPGTWDKVIGSAGILAAVVVFFYYFSLESREKKQEKHQPLLVAVFSAAVLAVALYMTWAGVHALTGAAWLPALVFLALCVYSFMTRNGAEI